MFVALSVAYPLVVYWAMGRFELRWLAVLLLALVQGLQSAGDSLVRRCRFD